MTRCKPKCSEGQRTQGEQQTPQSVRTGFQPGRFQILDQGGIDLTQPNGRIIVQSRAVEDRPGQFFHLRPDSIRRSLIDFSQTNRRAFKSTFGSKSISPLMGLPVFE